MDRCPNTSSQHQLWPISRPISPLTIPSPRLRPVTPSVHIELQKLRSSSQSDSTRPLQFRSHTPPLSPPLASPSVSYYYDSDIEIEELSDSPPGDSGIELLVGEYEEAPENYGKTEEEEDVKKDQRNMLFGLEKLSVTSSTVHETVRRKTE